MNGYKTHTHTHERLKMSNTLKNCSIVRMASSKKGELDFSMRRISMSIHVVVIL